MLKAIENLQDKCRIDAAILNLLLAQAAKPELTLLYLFGIMPLPEFAPTIPDVPKSSRRSRRFISYDPIRNQVNYSYLENKTEYIGGDIPENTETMLIEDWNRLVATNKDLPNKNYVKGPIVVSYTNSMDPEDWK